MNIKDIDKALAEHAEALNAIRDTVADFEEQGYAAGPILASTVGLEPGELLLHMLSTSCFDDSKDDLQRTVGVLRWCLDNRA
jgi:hypothetical protein